MKRLFLASFAKLYEYDSIKKEFSDCFAGRWTSVENKNSSKIKGFL
jgi:hypothetical protein